MQTRYQWAKGHGRSETMHCKTVAMSNTLNRRVVAAATVCSLVLMLASCGSDETTTDTSAAASSTASDSSPELTAVTVERAWARTSPMNVDNGAAYMTITSPIDDKVISAEVDPSVAADAQLHETSMGGGMSSDTMTSDTMAGMTSDTMAPAMEMREVEAVELPAGQPVSFEPGGYHIMLVGLAAPLDKGATFTITLTLEKAGLMNVTVVVADDAP